MMINVYHYHSNDLIMLAIPELFGPLSYQELDANQLYEELVMQLFNLLTEVEADTLASNITDLIRNESKGE